MQVKIHILQKPNNVAGIISRRYFQLCFRLAMNDYIEMIPLYPGDNYHESKYEYSSFMPGVPKGAVVFLYLIILYEMSTNQFKDVVVFSDDCVY